MTVSVKWGREKYTFGLPPPETKLGAIRQAIAEQIHLPAESFKLVHAGAVMRDDNAPISAYKLHENSTIAVIGGSDPVTQIKKPTPVPRTEQATILQIQAELNQVRGTLTPAVEELLGGLGAENSKPEKEHTRLGELLLQSLLRLDGITITSDGNGGWEDARRERKEAVREVQGVLDKLDGAFAE